MSNLVRIIALYLPQFHPIPENDEWWGKGFTEWTNVGKAKPLYRKHYQPRIPADLGYYDLRLSESRLAQAELAKKYGVDGFCYYHYWFDINKQLLEKPFQEVLNSGQPDFPFMLCWANESWHAKFWGLKGESSKKMLIEQKYNGIEDYKIHFEHLLPAFKDPRYIKINGKPAFMLYKPLAFDDVSTFIKTWQELALVNGLEGIHFIGQTLNQKDEKQLILDKGFDAINPVRIKEIIDRRSSLLKFFSNAFRFLTKRPLIIDYIKVLDYLTTEEDKELNVYPTIFPNWDHTPRSGYRGYLLKNSTPANFRKHLAKVFKVLSGKPVHKQICFIKSWNEWGEGNYMEPDLKYGKGFLEVLADSKKKHLE